MSAGFVEVKTPDGFKFFDFDKKVIRKALREVGRDVRKESRQLISKRAVSRPGEPPGKQSGELQRSVKATLSKSGHSVWIRPAKTSKMRDFYPAFVIFGHRGPGSDSIDQRSKKRKGQKVAEARQNFIETAANKYAPKFDSHMRDAFSEGFKE